MSHQSFSHWSLTVQVLYYISNWYKTHIMQNEATYGTAEDSYQYVNLCSVSVPSFCVCKALTGLPLIILLKIPWLFPDFSLTFYSFPYPLTDKKIIFIPCFNSANCITSNLGVTLKGKNLLPKGANSFLYEWPPMRKEIAFIVWEALSHEKVHPFPSWTE